MIFSAELQAQWVILCMKALLVKDAECTVPETHVLCSIAQRKKDTTWIAALSAPSLQLTSFAELEETPTGAEGSFILYSQVVVLAAKIAT